MYDVQFSQHVLEHVRELVHRNPEHSAELIASLREFTQRLRVYPQFGEPIWDLSVTGSTVWIGVVAPLVLHYVLDELHRRVIVVRRPQPLPRTGIV